MPTLLLRYGIFKANQSRSIHRSWSWKRVEAVILECGWTIEPPNPEVRMIRYFYRNFDTVAEASVARKELDRRLRLVAREISYLMCPKEN